MKLNRRVGFEHATPWNIIKWVLFLSVSFFTHVIHWYWTVNQFICFFQNEINAYIHALKYNQIDVNEKTLSWIPDFVKKGCTGPVQVKLLCGADLLESFATPQLWADEDVSGFSTCTV